MGTSAFGEMTPSRICRSHGSIWPIPDLVSMNYKVGSHPPRSLIGGPVQCTA